MLKIRATACAVMLLTACGAPKVHQTPGTGTVVPGPVPGAIAGYHIDTAHSELRLLVYRAGPMARFGHNHVIINRAVAGWIHADSTSAAAFSLSVPVTDFVVDDADARRTEGPDFSEKVPEDATSGTRRNMLGAALLDAEHFPTITLTSISVASMPGKSEATVAVEVAGHASTLVIPFTVETSEDRLTASGTVMLRQSTMGLTPFSIMLGALQVQDELTVKFKLVALKS